MTPSRDERLARYREKRKAGRTPEPFGGEVVVGGSVFVVQMHDARALHWDLRLELDGVLLSWAVPKGPSPNQADKRLAMQTEDHPLEYAEFEGVIPEGEYGAGPMIVWDRGTWTAVEDPHVGLEKGKLLFDLHGHKLVGRWTLVKTKQAPNSWLLIKERDGHMDPKGGTESYPEDSIYSGLAVHEFAHADEWAETLAERAAQLGAPEHPVRAADVDLMLATTQEAPFTREGWIFELKYDGYRLLAERVGREPFLRSRAGHDLTVTFPEIARAVRGLPLEGLVLDGEVVVHDAEGLPSFSKLQKRGRIQNKSDALRAGVELPAIFYAFGSLHIAQYDGDDLVYLGSVGSGFTDAELDDVLALLTDIEVDACPCTRGQLPKGKGNHWVRPALVAEERAVPFSNLDKLFWPEEGYTKGDLIEYHRAVAQWMLPYLEDRPLAMTRYPDGIHGKSFFQKDAPPFAPEWIRRLTLWSEGIHVLVPLGRQLTFEQCKTLGQLLARVVVAERTDIATLTRNPDRRGGKVYVDFLQNGHGKLLAAPFTARPRAGATVSAPLRWTDVTKRLRIEDHTIESLPRRMKRLGDDPLRPVLELEPDLLGALERLAHWFD